MRNLFKKSSYLLMLGAVSAQCLAAEDGPFQATASVQGVWDTNFSRSPLSDSEQTILSSAGLSFDDTFGRQRLIAKWRGSHYQYDKHTDFDSSTNSGELNWRGLFGSQFNADVDLLRNAYQVDRFEFFGKDIVTRDDLRAKIGYGNDHKLSFHLGGRQSTQTHSNYDRNSLDFDEDEVFVDAGYQTSNKSTIFLRYKSGNRAYTNPMLNPLDTDNASLDFDYNQVELEGQWVISPKTSISALVAGYKRDGSINDASGSVVTLSANWQATGKINIKGGYSFNEPAIGETSDSPSRIKTIFASALWQFSSKLSFGSSATYSIIDYEKVSQELIRAEKLYNLSPLTIVFDSGRHWQIRLDSGWRKNESPLAYRNYVSRQVSTGLFFYY